MSAFIDTLVSHKLFLSALLVIATSATRYVWTKRVRGAAEILSDDQRRKIARIKHGAVTVVLVGLFLVWLPELEKFALSIAAFVVAIVIATKELILCVGGTVMRASTGAYAVGDWIQIGGKKAAGGKRQGAHRRFCRSRAALQQVNRAAFRDRYP